MAITLTILESANIGVNPVVPATVVINPALPTVGATVDVGTTTTGAPGTNASVVNSGTAVNAVFDFTIPRGDQGIQGIQGIQGLQGIQGPVGATGNAGAAATIAVGSTETLAPGSTAYVTNGGTSSAAVLNFGLVTGQKGDKGDDGANGNDGAAATISVGTTTTGAAGSSASVSNSGSSSAAIFNFTIPRGDKGETGNTGATGATGPGVAAGGTTGQALVKSSNTSYDTTWTTIQTGDRYLTTSTTSLTLSNGSKTLTVGTGLAYTTQQDLVIAYDASNHMHGIVTSYNSGTGALVADIQQHTGAGTYALWTVNVGGTTTAVLPIGGTTGQVLQKSSNTNYDVSWTTPYAGADALKTANNLSELTATASTARTNLGLGTMATQSSASYALLASPTFTGVPAAPTAAANTNTTQIATTAFVTTAVNQKANVFSPTFTGTVTIPAGASISGYATIASPTFTGTPAAPTAATATNTTQIATTAYVKNQGYLTTATAATTYAPLASPTFTGTVTIPAGASISGYLTSATAASTYLTQTNAASTYQTQAAMGSYLTTSAAASTYYLQTNPAGYITSASLTGYATESWVNSQGFLTSASLTGYATESWVSSQGYLTDAPSDGSQYARQNGAWAVVTGGGGGAVWGGITGTVTDQTDLVTYITGLGYQTASDVSTYVTGLGYLTDAPSDGSIYGRKDGAWEVVAGGTAAANQLTAGVVTTNPTTGPTASGDVLQYDGTNLIWAAGGGGGGVAWGAITGTVTDQTDLTTYLSSNYYPLSSNPAGYLTSVPAPSVTNVDIGVGNYTLVLTDGGNTVNINAGDGSSSGYVIYIPDNTSVAFPIGTQILFTCSMASGTSFNYINGASGVTVIQASNGLNAGSMRRAVKLDTDTWMISSQI